ncbi:hypothetical protein AWQ21_07145 [Picosynechococcus sp. PCC 7003]|nr:hypothetical protein AWQ21_07145 [Picosynechococcus sp. PCC 7003]
MPDHFKEQKQLFAKYERCSSIEQQIMQVMAVIYSLTNRANIIRCLTLLNIDKAPNTPFGDVFLY